MPETTTTTGVSQARRWAAEREREVLAQASYEVRKACEYARAAVLMARIRLDRCDEIRRRVCT